jgi:biotin synthase
LSPSIASDQLKEKMCYAIPGKVKAIDKKIVTVDYFGEEKKAINEIDGLVLGDYIYAQGGYVVERLSPSSAESILNVWKETFFQLQEVDLRLSQLDLEKEGVDKKTSLILDKTLEGGILTLKEAQYFLSLENPRAIELLGKVANFIRQKNLKNSCCVHGIIEISNHCLQACTYCGISKSNLSLTRYRMTPDEVVASALEAVTAYGFKALVLQSGEDGGYTIEDLTFIIRSIKERAGVLICISFGEVGIDGLRRLYEAGARALLMRFETSNPYLYEKVHPGLKFDTRISHIKEALAMGYLIMTGGLIGIPGQTIDDIADDLFLAKELKAEMFSFGPFLPHPRTALGNVLPPPEELILKALSVARLIDPENAKILITTAFETLSDQARLKGLLAGANSVMLNITPDEKRPNYEIYPDRKHSKTKITQQIDETLSLLRSLGRAPTDLGIA